MKKKNIKVISLFLAVLMVLCMAGFTPANKLPETGAEKSVQDIAAYALEFMQESQTEKNITLAGMLPLFDLEDNVTGYYVIFESDGAQAGYILISLIDSGSPIVELSFEGAGPIEAALTELAKDTDTLVQEFSLAQKNAKSLTPGKVAAGSDKILYLGAGSIFVPEGEEYLSIYDHDMVEKAVVEEFEREPVISVQSAIHDGVLDWSKANISSSSVFKIKNFGAGADYRTMISFESGGVCVPTAMTNILWYWGNMRGKTSIMNQADVKAASGNNAKQNAIFDYLAWVMGTGYGKEGTADTNVQLGYRYFFGAHAASSGPWNYKSISNGSTFDTFKQAFDDNCPVQIRIRIGSEGHQVFGFGYAKSTTNTPYLFVMDGWNNYGRFIKMDYYSHLSGRKIWVQ